MHICVVYDCLFPYTIGGAERWYRNLAERLAAEGHRVTYLTLRHWPEGEAVEVPGVEVVAGRPQARRCTPRADGGGSGRRFVFGLGVLRHLIRAGARYDVVHTAAFPYFSLLAAAARAAPTSVSDRRRLVRGLVARVLARLPRAGRRTHRLAVQRRCIRVPHQAFCFSRLFARRLREQGLRGEVTLLEGIYAGPPGAPPVPAEPVVVFAGRHIPEKQATALVPAIALARERIPGAPRRDLRRRPRPTRGAAPDRGTRTRRSGGGTRVRARGRAARAPLRRALCLVLPSRREGYGLVVVEAAARGTPSVVVRGPGQRGDRAGRGRRERLRAPTPPTAEDLADAILRVHEAGPRCASRRRRGSSATPTGSRSSARSRPFSPPTRERRDAARRPERPPPRPRRDRRLGAVCAPAGRGARRRRRGLHAWSCSRRTRRVPRSRTSLGPGDVELVRRAGSTPAAASACARRADGPAAARSPAPASSSCTTSSRPRRRCRACRR